MLFFKYSLFLSCLTNFYFRVIGVDFDSFVSQWGGTCPTQSSNSSLGTGGYSSGVGGTCPTQSSNSSLGKGGYSSGVGGTCHTQSSNSSLGTGDTVQGWVEPVLPRAQIQA